MIAARRSIRSATLFLLGNNVRHFRPLPGLGIGGQSRKQKTAQNVAVSNAIIRYLCCMPATGYFTFFPRPFFTSLTNSAGTLASLAISATEWPVFVRRFTTISRTLSST
jgi:hypothetical protein